MMKGAARKIVFKIIQLSTNINYNLVTKINNLIPKGTEYERTNSSIQIRY